MYGLRSRSITRFSLLPVFFAVSDSPSDFPCRSRIRRAVASRRSPPPDNSISRRNVGRATIASVACQDGSLADSPAENTYLRSNIHTNVTSTARLERNPSYDLCIARNSQNDTTSGKTVANYCTGLERGLLSPRIR